MIHSSPLLLLPRAYCTVISFPISHDSTKKKGTTGLDFIQYSLLYIVMLQDKTKQSEKTRKRHIRNIPDRCLAAERAAQDRLGSISTPMSILCVGKFLRNARLCYIPSNPPTTAHSSRVIFEQATFWAEMTGKKTWKIFQNIYFSDTQGRSFRIST